MPQQTMQQSPRTSAILAQEPAPQLANMSEIKGELGLVAPQDIKGHVEKKVDPKLVQQAESFTSKLLAINESDAKQRQNAVTSVEDIGIQIERKATNANQLLQQPLRRLGTFGGEGNQIADMLTDVKVQFDIVDPSKFDFEAGWFGRMVSVIPGVGSKANRYFTRFEASGKVIDSLFNSLEVSKGQLLRDIETLMQEQVEMRTATLRLQDLIIVCQLIDEKLQAELERIDGESDRAKFIGSELLFPLRQRITDLQQQLIVNQQGVLMFEVLVRNNKELIRGIKRCKNVTYPALLIGVETAQALASQKIVIGKIDLLNKAGDKFIQFNANLLKTQGVEINKRASSSQLSDSVLAQAMKDVVSALNDIETFRGKAIEQMAAAIKERSALTASGEKSISKMEAGNRATITLQLDEETTGPKNQP